MLFNSVQFLVFFPIVVLIYALIPRKARMPWLLVASYFFYMSWHAEYAILIALSTVVTWGGALVMDRVNGKGGRKSALVLTLVVNLGILFFFKYFDFAAQSLARILSVFHITLAHKGFDVLLPVGISFYTFQALGYCIDVYRRDVAPEKNLLKYALFVSFFPQLVAGPIERSGNLLKQLDRIEEIRVRDTDRMVSGLTLMLWGLFMKMVIADRLAVTADTVFDRPYLYGTCGLLTGAIAFSLQIYCDFCAYSTIARGAARVMGFTLTDNFDTPYFAQDIRDFWGRWHISLTAWFRDYLYIPLGGNRCSSLRKNLNILITFTVSGLWHGAAWNFVVWGALHGLYRILSDFLKKPVRALGDLLHIGRENFSYRLGRILITDFLVMIAWIFFRAESIRGAFAYIVRLFTHPDPWTMFDGSLYKLGLSAFEAHVLLYALLILFAVDLMKHIKKIELPEFLARQNLWFRWLVLIGMIMGIVVYGAYGVVFDSTQFIYFTF
ncbi:MAG: MBOAT family protein [Lachnospiraceae bacterium]|nr:MBOAT family protein [Lachnospiraceae bacterium]